MHGAKRSVLARIVFWLVLVGVAVPFILGAVQKYTAVDKPPGLVDAPFIVQTSSRVYYGRQMRLDGQTPTLRGYWTLTGKHYTYSEGTISFPQKTFWKVAIVRRTTQ